jgi:hypothetical protein
VVSHGSMHSAIPPIGVGRTPLRAVTPERGGGGGNRLRATTRAIEGMEHMRTNAGVARHELMVLRSNAV